MSKLFCQINFIFIVIGVSTNKGVLAQGPQSTINWEFWKVWNHFENVLFGKISNTCPQFPANVQCFVSPCMDPKACPSGLTCCEDYSYGCKHICIGSNNVCPKFPQNYYCFNNPCWNFPSPCSPGFACCPDYSTGCNYVCIPLYGQTGGKCPHFDISDCMYEDCSNSGCPYGELCCPKPCGGTWCQKPV